MKRRRTLPAEVTIYLNSPDLPAETLRELAEVLIGLARTVLVALALLAYIAGALGEMWQIAAGLARATLTFDPARLTAAWCLGRVRWYGI